MISNRHLKKPVLLIAFLFALLPGWGIADPFSDAMTTCSSSRDHMFRVEKLHDKGWHLVMPTDALAKEYRDALAISNQPKENTAEAWASTREWSHQLMPSLLDNSVSILAKDTSLLLLRQQAQTGNSTCVLMASASHPALRFIETLDEAGGVRDWGYGLQGKSLGVVTDDDGHQWQTNITIYLARNSELPRLSTPLNPILTATTITQQVR